MAQTDKELIHKSLNGSLTAFDTIINRYQDSVYKLCLTIGKNEDNALDIMQNTFIKVYDKLYTFNRRSTFKSWLLKITYNEGINWIRKNKKYFQHSLFEEEKYLIVSSEQDRSEKYEWLNKSIMSLNPRYRSAIILRYYENLSIKEIAESLKCSEGVVKNMLFRSLRKMKGLI